MKINNKIILPICGFLFGFLCLIIALKKYEIVVNYSESLPYKFVIIDKSKKPTKKGQIAVFYVLNNKELAVEKIKFIKIYGGSEGSEILLKNNKIFVDDFLIGEVKEKSKKNQKLTAIQSQIISKQKYFFYSLHQDSFDSRYQEIGLIDEKNIVGTVIFAY